ncbi:MetS family NSS transporter small subunit [Halobacillus locisalis]|uniref:MetS family NSS transporter small subunit n=1 Tax=Halobacillus locisalis TaxID=220753 RepID=A0A838CQD8_9BACI|nr:MetS family NSS transporter small subunit [Halobacillus locisalis]MBA2174174.1 MetS family NSS transporter small subunit [Halobacillus locisalis]
MDGSAITMMVLGWLIVWGLPVGVIISVVVLFKKVKRSFNQNYE